MRTRDEFIGEVFARSKIRREEYKKKKKQVAVIFSLILCVCIGSIAMLNHLGEEHITGSESNNTAIEKADLVQAEVTEKEMVNGYSNGSGTADGNDGKTNVIHACTQMVHTPDFSVESYNINCSEMGYELLNIHSVLCGFRFMDNSRWWSTKD